MDSEKQQSGPVTQLIAVVTLVFYALIFCGLIMIARFAITSQFASR
jgi:hypothetical protein